MQFNSYIFILLFLPLAIIGYYGLNALGKEKLAKVYLLVMSLWFYDYFNVIYLVIICASIAVNYLLSKGMSLLDGNRRKITLLFGIIFNVGLIFYFKYKNFFISNINEAFGTGFHLQKVILPLGISFFTFQQIAYIVDSYKGETKDYGFIEYALFVIFFPQLVEGPIVLHSEIIPQFRDKSKWKVDYDNLSKGLMMFARGLTKKVLIADAFGVAVEWGFSVASSTPLGEGALTIWEIIIVMLSYTFQIYFDFSGYSDMAIGLGLMFNIVLPANFNSPYKALSIIDFWKRWHMSLTRFLTKYIYIPLGGNRKGVWRTYLNIMIVFFVSGIWHGANWTFILWGLIHGAFQCINRAGKGIYTKCIGFAERLPVAKVWISLIQVVQWVVTFIIINVAWLLFRADSVGQFTQIMSRLTVHNYSIRTELLESFRIPKIRYLFALLGQNPSEMFTLGLSTVVVMMTALFIVLILPNNGQCQYKKSKLNLVCTFVMMIICMISLSKVSTFLYFNF